MEAIATARRHVFLSAATAIPSIINFVFTPVLKVVFSYKEY
jgi:hypothetical protein